MHDPIVELVDAGADAAQQQLLRALELQAGALARVRRCVGDALDTVPASTYRGWQGLAALAFDLAVSDLRRDLATSLTCLDAARSETRQAIATLHGRM